MVNLSRIDKNVYKSLGFKNKSIGQTMIKVIKPLALGRMGGRRVRVKTKGFIKPWL